jgi:phosphoglycolate phosphatase-like HAD superfamily hydrolase
LENSVKPIDLLVFDCDGVLLDTLPAKIKAFRDCVPEAHQLHRIAFMQLVMSGFGKSRARHIRAFYEEILKESVSEEFLESEVGRFTDICEPLCTAAEWLPGSREFVIACRNSGIPTYVLSGTPQAALEEMLVSTSAADLFDLIIGSLLAKPESLARIHFETNTRAHRCAFVGDAEADRGAAEHGGTHFVYLPSAADRPTGPLATEVSDLRQLQDTP